MKKLIWFTLSLLPTFSFAESLKYSIQNRQFVKLDQASAEKYNINVSAVLSEVGAGNQDFVFVEVNEKNEVVDIGIFDQEVFAEKRLDWRTH